MTNQLPVVTLHHKGNSRFYRVAGDDKIAEDAELVPVTTVLGSTSNKSFLAPWRVKLALGYLSGRLEDIGYLTSEDIEAARSYSQEISDNAGNFGTEIHKLVSILATGGSADVPQGYAIALRNASDWIDAMGMRVVASELPVYSRRYLYAGTIDLVLKDESIEEYIIVDFKTSAKIDKEHVLQVVAYAAALNEMWGITTEDKLEDYFQCCVVRLEKEKSGYKVHTQYPTLRVLTMFRSALFLHMGNKDIKIKEL